MQTISFFLFSQDKILSSLPDHVLLTPEVLMLEMESLTDDQVDSHSEALVHAKVQYSGNSSSLSIVVH